MLPIVAPCPFGAGALGWAETERESIGQCSRGGTLSAAGAGAAGPVVADDQPPELFVVQHGE